MTTPKVIPHLTTTNIYLQENILLNNIQNIQNHQSSKFFSRAPNQYKYAVKDLLKTQRKFLYRIRIKIMSVEQTSFAFGGILSR